MTIAENTTVITYEPRGSAREAFYSRDREVLLCGGAGTGKTRAALEKVHLQLSRFPGSRALLLRKTHASLKASALVTYATEVLKPSDGVVYFNGNNSTPPQFQYPNGAVALVGGLDDPGKIMSAQYDLVYVNEATDVSVTDWESIITRLRNGKMDYNQLIADCNPGPPTHWLKKRCDSGATRLLTSTHEDNPRYYDEKGRITVEGMAYMDGLDSLTGVRKQRLRFGIWAAAEGRVYDDWDAGVHLIDPFRIPEDWPKYRSIDFGYQNPFVCLWGAVSPDNRLYIYRQIYMSKRLVNDHARDIITVSGAERFRKTLADHALEDRATLHAAKIPTVPAKKDIRRGIDAMQDRLRIDNTGKPGLMVFRDSLPDAKVKYGLVREDPEMKRGAKPTCLQEEIDSYVWKTGVDGKPLKEEPLGIDDHACDAARYLCVEVVKRRSSVLPVFINKSSVWHALTS